MRKELEREILGSILLNQDILVEVKSIVSPDDFSTSENRTIYEVMLKMKSSGVKIDEVTLGNALSGVFFERSPLEIQGLMMELMCLMGCSKDAPHYAKLLLEHSIGDKVGELFTTVSDRIERGEFDFDEIDEVKDEIGRLKNQSACQNTKSISAILRASDDEGSGYIPLGYSKLDTAHSGGLVGEFTVLAGSPSTGKSQFAINLLLRAKKNGVPVKGLYICQEMSEKDIQDRMVGALSSVPLAVVKGIRRDLAPDSAWEQYGNKYQKALKELVTRDIRVHAQSKLSIPELEAIVMRNINEIDIIVIDYLQQIRKVDRHQSDFDKINDITEFCQDTALRYDTPIIGLSQFNRDGYKDPSHKPTMGDLRGSGQIEQDAANIWLLWRDLEDKNLETTLELNIAKNRNGQIGRINFDYKKDCGRIRESLGYH